MPEEKKAIAQIKDAPEKPGVYVMRDAKGKVLYVGKAKNLKNRVATYFKADAEKRLTIISMREKIDDIEYLVVNTENEALLLEDNLIKTYLPKYNSLLKDDKKYPSIKLSINEIFPRLYKVRQKSNDGAIYFGPFATINTTEIIKKIQDNFQLRHCKTMQTKPCIYAQMKTCCAPCLGNVTMEDYAERVKKVINFLNSLETVK